MALRRMEVNPETVVILVFKLEAFLESTFAMRCAATDTFYV